MSDDFFTHAAFDARLAARRANPVPPSPHAVFFHISLMPGWEPVVSEQLRLLAHVGLTTVHSCVVGTTEAVDRLRDIEDGLGVNLVIHDTAQDFGVYERPTLDAVHRWAKAHPSGAVTYLHTKGVSAPSDLHKRHWRRAMMRHVVADWRDNLKKLAVADVLGCGWQTDPHYPHFCGNFWAARCDWLARLPGIDEYRHSRPDWLWSGTHSWRERMCVESWIGARNFHHVEDLVGHNYHMWDDAVYRLPTGIEGFSYDPLPAPIDSAAPILVLIPTKPNMTAELLDASLAAEARMVARCRGRVQVVRDFRGSGDEALTGMSGMPGLNARVRRMAPIRQAIVDDHLRPWHSHVVWFDADVIRYPPDLPALFVDRHPNAVSAPRVLANETQWYDTAGFIDRDGKWASLHPPFFRSQGEILDLLGVGCVYCVPAGVYREGGRHEPDDEYTEHRSVCTKAREMGLRVLCDTSLTAYHAHLQDFGEAGH